MNSIEFGKKCQPLNIEYRKLFDYVPCRDDYVCTQEEYLEALGRAVSEKKELTVFLTKRDRSGYVDPHKRY